jgi:hypothetical protein
VHPSRCGTVPSVPWQILVAVEAAVHLLDGEEEVLVQEEAVVLVLGAQEKVLVLGVQEIVLLAMEISAARNPLLKITNVRDE